MTTFLHGVEVLDVPDGARPLRPIDLGTIGLVGTAPGRWDANGPVAANPLNDPVLVRSAAEGAREFGSGLGTIGDALEAIDAQGVSPRVVVVNALDPATHRAAVGRARHVMADGVATLSHKYVQDVVVLSAAAPVAESAQNLVGDAVDLGAGYITDVVVKNAAGSETYDDDDYTVDPVAATVTRKATGDIAAGAALKIAYNRHTQYVDGTDYKLDAVAGTVTRVEGGGIVAANAPVEVSYARLDAAAVADADIAGDAAARTGVHALLGAAAETGATPRVLIAPGHSQNQAVASALIAAADRLRGVAVIDGPDTTDAAAIAYRDNFDSRRAYLVDPGAKVADADDTVVSRPMSAYVAGVMAKTDQDLGYWFSPSNKPILGIVGTGRPVDFALGDPASRANLLNDKDVATVIRESGWRLWGNRTLSGDTKWAFLNVVRTADALNGALLRSHLWAVDRNITRTYLEDVAAGVNAFIREQVALGALIGGGCVPSPDLNTPESVAAGRVYFDMDFTPPSPAERVTFRSHLVNDYIEEILA